MTPTTTERLQPSSLDNVELAKAVETRFLQLCELHERMTGLRLVPPESMRSDMLRWRKMVLRHRRGDMRHRPSELKATRAIAQFTVDVHNRLCGQAKNTIEWSD